jgi:hypothetical protein
MREHVLVVGARRQRLEILRRWVRCLIKVKARGIRSPCEWFFGLLRD